MKKIIALLAIVAMSFNAKAAGVRIINNTGYTFFGNFTNVGVSGAGVSFYGTAPITLNAWVTREWASVGLFYMEMTGDPTMGPYTSPLDQVQSFWFEPIGPPNTFFAGQPGSSIFYPCPLIPAPAVSGFHVTTAITPGWTIITINNW